MGRTNEDQVGERDRVVELLYELLTPAVCRRLGIYQWPEGFILSVLIPVFNERATIEKLIRRVQNVDVPCELIVVDDASTDGTREILQSLRDRANLKIVYHPQNRGKGAALRTGLTHATGTAVIIQDADLEYDPSDYPLLLRPCWRIARMWCTAVVSVPTIVRFPGTGITRQIGS